MRLRFLPVNNPHGDIYYDVALDRWIGLQEACVDLKVKGDGQLVTMMRGWRVLAKTTSHASAFRHKLIQVDTLPIVRQQNIYFSLHVVSFNVSLRNAKTIIQLSLVHSDADIRL